MRLPTWYEQWPSKSNRKAAAVGFELLNRLAIVPFFVFQGAADNVTPVPPVRDYVDTITAPRKELVLIEGAGHNAMATKRDEFLKLLVERVGPLALQ